MDVGELFKQYYLPVKRYAIKLCHDTDLADDLTQEAFIRLSRQSNTTNPLSFLKTGVFWSYLNHIRDTREHDELNDNHWTCEAPQLNDMIDEANKDIVYTLIGLLPKKQKQVFIYLLQGYTNKQIAEKMNTNYETAKSRVMRGIINMRRIAHQLTKKSFDDAISSESFLEK